MLRARWSDRHAQQCHEHHKALGTQYDPQSMKKVAIEKQSFKDRFVRSCCVCFLKLMALASETMTVHALKLLKTRVRPQGKQIQDKRQECEHKGKSQALQTHRRFHMIKRHQDCHRHPASVFGLAQRCFGLQHAGLGGCFPVKSTIQQRSVQNIPRKGSSSG